MEEKALIPFSRGALAIIAGYGLVLNAIWEFAQAGALYDMWTEVSLAAGLFHITLAIIGDVFLVLAISIVVGWICGTSKVLALGWQAILCMLMIGFVTGLVLEWTAKAFNWWTYNELMPTVTLFGETVGWFPLLQITLLPFFSVVLAVKLDRLFLRLSTKYKKIISFYYGTFFRTRYGRKIRRHHHL